MRATNTTASQQQLAVFIDFENIALGLNTGRFKVRRVLDRLLEKGKVIAKVAYADWNRFREYTRDLHENGFELIEIPRRATTGKNSADIRLVVDAMDLSWSKEHIDTFVIVSGDSDFSPLVSKLKENGRHVIGLGMKASTSPLLANGCDEFIYYEDLEREHESERDHESEPDHDPENGDSRPRARAPRDKDSAFRLLAETVRALEREGFGVMQASLVKDAMKRKRPDFNEAGLGYGSFSDLLESAQEAGIVTLKKDDRSGTYVVTLAPGAAPSRTRGRRGAGVPREDRTEARGSDETRVREDTRDNARAPRGRTTPSRSTAASARAESQAALAARHASREAVAVEDDAREPAAEKENGRRGRRPRRVKASVGSTRSSRG